MQMTLIAIKEKDKIWWTQVHSNWHYLKILKNVVDHFRYDFLGCDVGKKNLITAKQLIKKINKVVLPFEIWDWELGIDLRKENFKYIDNIIMMDLSHDTFGCNDLYVYVKSSESIGDEVYNQLKVFLKEIRKR